MKSDDFLKAHLSQVIRAATRQVNNNRQEVNRVETEYDAAAKPKYTSKLPSYRTFVCMYLVM